MKFVNVESSNIAAIAHDPDTSKMRVRFHGGTTYEYSNVPRPIFDLVREAASVGRTFNQLVKTNPERYPYERVA